MFHSKKPDLRSASRIFSFEMALDRIEQLRAEALSLLPAAIPSDCRDALVAYLDYVISRNK